MRNAAFAEKCVLALRNYAFTDPTFLTPRAITGIFYKPGDVIAEGRQTRLCPEISNDWANCRQLSFFHELGEDSCVCS